MQIKGPARIASFLKAPDRGIEGALIYGPDEGLVHERALALQAAILGAKPDPFQLIEMTEQTLKDAPGALYAEAASVSMLGGRKFIRLRSDSDAARDALLAYSEAREAGAPAGDAFIVIEAGDLKKTSALRKAAEGSEIFAVIACYLDSQESLDDLIDGMLAAAGARIAPEAKFALIERLGSDRGISRQEIEKLLTFVGAAPGKQVEIGAEDVREIVGDSSAAEIDRLIDAVFVGRTEEVVLASTRLYATGMNPVGILRIVAGHFERMGSSGAGESGYGGGREAARQRRAARWSADHIARAQSALLDAERQCKTTGMPAKEICQRLLVSLARGASRAAPG